jgi:TolB-like protein/class 3 adenylate cyclase/Tfp pilus assembly protein PilF
MSQTRRLAAILAADVAGYSRLMGADEEGTHERLKAHLRELVDPKIAEHRGRTVKNTGDGFLAEFTSVVDAVRCAVDVQRGMADREAEAPEERLIRFRIGINLGDVIVEEHDIFGDGVNVAARLEGLAEPGGICVSRMVRDNVRDKLDLVFEDMGEQSVKNIARPVRVYTLRPEAVADLLAASLPAIGRRRRRAIAGMVAAVTAALVIAGSAWWLWPLTKPSPPTVAATTTIAQPFQAPRLSIVVLPFANLSNDPDQQYFADGITEDVTTDLSRLPDMFVISRNSAFTYRNKPVETRQIGRELGVRYVLEGSVQRSGNQVRVNAQLIDAETGAHLWAERFDRDIGDLFALQNEITARIARALQVQLPLAEARRPTDNPDARDYILRGRAVLTRPISKENSNEAAALFEKALALDTRSADAATWLAATLAFRVTDDFSDEPYKDLHRAEGLVAQALAMSPDSALAHYVKGQVLFAQSRCGEAIPEYERAITLDRSRTAAYGRLGWCKFLTGSVDAAIPYFEEAMRLSPHEPIVAPWYRRMGVIYLLQSRIDEAIASLEKAGNENARLAFVHAYLAAGYALKGETERARGELAEAQGLSKMYSSLAGVEKSNWFDDPKIRALAEATYFPGLRKAGMPEE